MRLLFSECLMQHSEDLLESLVECISEYFVSVLLTCERYLCTHYLLKIPRNISQVTTDPDIWEATHFVKTVQPPKNSCKISI
jgi:hypothetical protein